MNSSLSDQNLHATTLIIFGITGDLARRKLLPGLYSLAEQNLLPANCRIVGITRRGVSVTDLLQNIRQSVEASNRTCKQTTLEYLSDHIEIMTMNLLEAEDYARLRSRLDAIEDETKVCMNRLFYLAVPSQVFAPVITRLGESGLNKSCQHHTGESHLLIEKPFGYDLVSAQDLITEVGKYFNEDQIYRIDHYLAKETAQNILTFRFQNPLFKKVWDHDCIKTIMITAAETIDIEGRTVFYEQTGALRDLVQSHLLQLLALTTMEEPAQLDSNSIHEQKLALLRAIQPIASHAVTTQAVRGQYEGYQQDVNNTRSITETYAAIQLQINNDRWRNVPILLRAGKALAEKVVEIAIVFADDSDITIDNTLVIRIQPNEGIVLQLLAKRPGLTNMVEPVHMEFCYTRSFTDSNHPDAYERVLVDAFRGDKTLFATSEEVLASWQVLEHVVTAWTNTSTDLHIYPKGSWGPEAGAMLAKTAAGIDWPDQTLPTCAV